MRNELGLNQRAFARKVGVNRAATVSDWERGVAIPPADRLVAIAALAGRDAEQLFGGWADEVRRNTEFERLITSQLPNLVTDRHYEALDSQWLRDFENVVRNVGGKGGTLPPDERRARQRDLVNGMIDARKQRGAEVPGELYALLGRLEHGDL